MINFIKQTLLKLSSGSTFLEISKKAFENITIALPPKKNNKK
jgi:restriction endonuclease S subunit